METFIGAEALLCILIYFGGFAYAVYHESRPEQKRRFKIASHAREIRRLIDAIESNKKHLDWVASLDWLRKQASVPLSAHASVWLSDQDCLKLQEKKIAELNKTIGLLQSRLEEQTQAWRELIEHYESNDDKSTYRVSAKVRVCVDIVEELEADLEQYKAKARA